jgi:uncharacterized OB-fold protein
MAKEERHIAPPVPDVETKPFWEAAAEGRLLIKRCNSCGNAHYYPRSICPFCFSADTQWQDASGEGVIYSFSIMRRAAPPYCIAYVTLAEGVTMMTNIVACDLDAIQIGQRVRLAFRPSDGGPPVPMFTPV